jgi:hypothetical protein
MIKYTATVNAPEYTRTDFDTAEAAASYVEQTGSLGKVVEFYGHDNLPFCLPAIVYKALTMWTYTDGKWFSHYIHDGFGAAIQESRPQ